MVNQTTFRETALSVEDLKNLRREKPATWPLKNLGFSFYHWMDIFDAIENEGADPQAIADHYKLKRGTIIKGMWIWRNRNA